MSDHRGRRRRPSSVPVVRLVILGVALAGIVRLLMLPEPIHAPSSTPLTVLPALAGPLPTSQSATLADQTAYQPRIYLTPELSVGVAPSRDRQYLRLLLRGAAGKVTELRRLRAVDHPQLDGFTASGDTLVWAETLSSGSAATTLWSSNWRKASRPAVITTAVGEATFYGSQYDLVVNAGKVVWTAAGSGSGAVTEVRSVALAGGSVSVQHLSGEYALSAWPWAVSVTGGRGQPVQLVNLSTHARVTVATSSQEIASCGPRWCRVAVLGTNGLERIDIQRPDGSQRRRIAGAEATPTLVDVALLDRFVPLATDRGARAGGPGEPPGPAPSDDGAGQARPGVDLSLYDISTATIRLIATDVANVSARGTMLWWSTGSSPDLVWNAIDLNAIA